jgi:hypothetical protein
MFLQCGKRKNINWKAQFNFNMGNYEGTLWEDTEEL